MKFGVWLGSRSPFDESYTNQMWGASAHAHVHTAHCTPLSHDGAFAVARSSPITAPYR